MHNDLCPVWEIAKYSPCPASSQIPPGDFIFALSVREPMTAIAQPTCRTVRCELASHIQTCLQLKVWHLVPTGQK